MFLFLVVSFFLMLLLMRLLMSGFSFLLFSLFFFLFPDNLGLELITLHNLFHFFLILHLFGLMMLFSLLGLILMLFLVRFLFWMFLMLSLSFWSCLLDVNMLLMRLVLLFVNRFSFLILSLHRGSVVFLFLFFSVRLSLDIDWSILG